MTGAVDWGAIAPARPLIQPAPCASGLTVASSYGVQWVAESAKWREAVRTGRHPTTGKAFSRTEALHGARQCVRSGQLARVRALPTHARPVAGPGLTSYRAHGRYGLVMIGARDDADAMREARRSTDLVHGLDRWNGAAYAPVNLGSV